MLVNMDAIETLVSKATTRSRLPTPTECKTIREQAGVTQAELSEALGVSRQTLIHWERGERIPRSSHRLRYVRALEMLKSTSDARN